MNRLSSVRAASVACTMSATVLAANSVLAVSFDGGGDGTSWEDLANWNPDGVPSSSGNGVTTEFFGDVNVELDGAAWSFFQTNSLLTGGSTGEYRGSSRLLVGDVPGSGTQVLTFDYGDANIARFTANSSMIVGGKSGQNSSLTHISGDTRFEANLLTIGNDAGATGEINLESGRVIFSRETSGVSLRVGNNGSGTLNVDGGRLRTRAGVSVGSSGEFVVNGSNPLEISIGDESSVDGRWTQASGGILKVGIDEGGLTSIVVADKGGSGTFATFSSGSLLDVSFLSTPESGTWTVMQVVNGDITDEGLNLVAGTGWSYNIDNSGADGILTVSYVPEPSSMVLAGMGVLALLGRHRRD